MPMRWLWRALPVAILAPLLAACSMEGAQSTFQPVGEIARAQKDLFMWTFWLSWIVMIGVFGTMIYVVFRYRARKGDDTIPVQSHGNPAVEVILTIIPVIILVMVAIPTVRSVFATQSYVEASDDDLIVNVVGHQWWWSFEYPQYGFTTANELHAPVGKRVVLKLNSADVVHAFWAPRIAGKIDLIPNQDNQMWFRVDETGVFPGQCAELCLGAHAYMRFRVVVSEDAEFDSWVKEFQEPELVTAPSDPQIAQGRQLVASKGCIGCHAIENYAEGLSVGQAGFPNLTNFGLRHSVGAGVLDATHENVAAWLADPQKIKPGNYMPTLWEADDPKRDDETAAIAAYLLSLGAPDDAQPLARAATGGN